MTCTVASHRPQTIDVGMAKVITTMKTYASSIVRKESEKIAVSGSVMDQFLTGLAVPILGRGSQPKVNLFRDAYQQ